MDIDEHSCIDCYLCIHSYVYYTSQILCFDVYNRCTKMSHVYCPDTFTSALLMEGISAALVCLQFTCCHITCVLYAGCIYFETMYTKLLWKGDSPQLYYLLPINLIRTPFTFFSIAIEKQCVTPHGVSRYYLVYSILNCNLVLKQMVMHVNKA